MDVPVEQTTAPAKGISGVARVLDYRKIYVTNVVGGQTSQDFRFELMNEKITTEQGTFSISEGMIILTPIGAKRLLIQLSRSISDYERKHGMIPENPEEEIFIPTTG